MNPAEPSQKLPRPTGTAIDEIALASPAVAATYAAIEKVLKNQPGGIAGVTSQAERLMRDFGLASHFDRDTPGSNHSIPFDPIPRLIDPNEWTLISKAIAQRLAVWNAFFSDVYNNEEILKCGILPFELVYDDPNYQRAAVNVSVPLNTYVHVAAFDLLRSATGQWTVVDDDVSLSHGASYALQGRHVLNQVCSPLLATAEITSARAYPTTLLEHLRQFAPSSVAEPRVVLLSSATYDHSTSEHGYLARQMGVPLVRGGDLIVLNTKVYLKTIGGLEPIDVIFRRVHDRSIDPVAMASQEPDGIPGLMSCIRKGSVAIANAIGTGLGDNRAVAAYLPKLARFYLGEQLQFPSVQRLLCFDADQCEQVLSNLHLYSIFDVSQTDHTSVCNPSTLTRRAQDQLREQIRTNPAAYVAQPTLPLNLLPGCNADTLRPTPASLRIFAFGSQPPVVFPCALTQVDAQPGARISPTGLQGGIKDTWILQGSNERDTEKPIRIATSLRRLRLGSRTADSFFWIGRYAERAENTTRILKVLNSIQLEDPAHQDPQRWHPLWESLARATGHPTHFFKRSTSTPSLPHYILLDSKNPSSVLNCLHQCRLNALSTRESIPPEVWAVINNLHLLVRDAAHAFKSKSPELTELSRFLELQQTILNHLDALAGAALKHLLRDGGWHFWNLGVYLERAITTVMVTRQIFLKQPDPRPFTSDSNDQLHALLRMLSCLYAYRSLFQVRPTAENVATLVLQDPTPPHSLLYCLQGLRDALLTAFGDDLREPYLTPGRRCAKLHAEVAYKDLSQFFSPREKGRPPSLTRWLNTIATDLNNIALSISDHYLYHQAINVLK